MYAQRALYSRGIPSKTNTMRRSSAMPTHPNTSKTPYAVPGAFPRLQQQFRIKQNLFQPCLSPG